MPRHLISDAHEWINEIPTVPTVPHSSPNFLSPLSLPQGGDFSPQQQCREQPPTRGCRRSSPAATWMAGPPSHVPPSSLVPSTVQPLSSSTPSLSASSPRSDPDPPLSLLRNPTSSNPHPPPPPSQIPTPSPAPPPPPLLPSPPYPCSSSEIHASLNLFPPRSASVSAAANPFPSLPSSSAPLPSVAISSDPLSSLPPLIPPAPNPIPSSLPVPHLSTPAPDLVVPPSASVPSPHHTTPTIPSRPQMPNPHRSSNPSHHQPSYAQIARGTRGPGFVRSHASDVEAFARLPRTGINIICGSREGLPSFSFTNSDLPRVEKLYSNALVMKFHGGRPSLESSHKEISSWGMNQPFSIGPLSSRAFLLRFQDETDLLKVLTRPSTALINFPYKVFRWHSLCHIKEDSCIAPVWISLPRLPLQCFVPEFLESVANKIGRFLCLDKATATLARPSAARLCVELDLRRPPPPFIWVGLFDGFKQAILYEKLPKFCNDCHIQGHSTVECFKAPPAADCPQGHRETPPTQTGDRNIPDHQRAPPVRQNASKHPIPLHHQPTSTSTPPPPHIPIPPPNPPPPSSQSLQTTLIHSPQATATANTSRQAVPPQLLTHPPPNNPTAGLPLPLHPNTPHKSSSLPHSSRNIDKHKRKSVTFEPPPVQPLPSLDANATFWEAVNRQIAIIEQERLTSSSSTPGQSSAGMDPISAATAPPPITSEPESHPNALSDPESPSVTDSPTSSLPTNFQDAQDPSDDINSSKIASYDSAGEEPITDPVLKEGHATDDSLILHPQSSKRNKRHPNQPLKVQLRVRRDPTSTSS